MSILCKAEELELLGKALRAKITKCLKSIFYPDAFKPMVDGVCSKFQ